MPTDKLIPAAAYARCSLQEQVEKGLSIPAQLDEIHRWAKSHGYEIVMEFVDAGRRGSDDTREEFVRLRKMASEKKPAFQAILIWKSDRMARDTEQAAIFRGLLRRNGIDLLSVTEPNIDGPVGALMSSILDAIAAFYSGQLSESCLRGAKQGVRQGFVQGGTAPFGLRRVPVENLYGKTKWKYAPDPATAPWVRWIYERYSEGATLRTIADELIRKDVPTRRGGVWSSAQLSKILFYQQSTYLGAIVYNRTKWSKGRKARPNGQDDWIVKPEAHDPILNPELVERVNRARIGRPNLNENVRKTRPTVLDGLVYCGLCGRRMYLCTSGGKSVAGYSYVYYRCNPKTLASLEGGRVDGLHEGFMIRVDHLTEVVLGVVREKVLGKNFKDALREEISERGKKQEESTGKLREGLEREKNRIEVRRNALAEAVLDGSIPRDVARRKQEELTTGLSEIERQLEALDVTPPPHPIEELRNIPAHAIAKALETDKGLRSIFVALVARVEMTPEHRGKICFTGLYPPEEIAVPRRRGQKPPIA